MTALSGVRRRRTGMMLLANLVVLAAVGGLLYTGVKALARYQGAKNTSVATIPIPLTPVGMVATVDDKNKLTSVAVFVEKPNGRGGGSIVNVPISADSTEGTDGQYIPLSEAYDTGGADGLTQAVESVLSLTVDESAVRTPDELTAMLAPFGPFKVTFPTKVAATDKTGTVTLYPRGVNNMSAKQMTIAMNARVKDQREATRLPNIQAIWAGLSAAIGQGRGSPTTGDATSFDQLAAQVFAGPVLSRGLPVIALASGVGGGKDVDTLDRAEAVMVFATIAPNHMSAVMLGLNFRIEAPPGYDDRVKFVVRALLYLNCNVQWVYTNGPVHAETIVFLNDPTLSGQAAGSELIFKKVTTKEPEYRIEGVDVIVQIGTDYLNDTSLNVLPATTTTSTIPD